MFSKQRRRELARSWGVQLGSSLIRAGTRSIRLTVLGQDHLDRALQDHGAVIYAFWHNSFWILAGRFGHTRAGVMVSLSEDGEVIAQAAARLGFTPVRGSSSRGGKEALKSMESLLAQGTSVALTPDGPRGPRYRAQIGAVLLAARSGKPILPMSAWALPGIEFRSWDRFRVPAPWARGVVAYGKPLHVPNLQDLEPRRQQLEASLTGCHRTARARLR